ncbi:hypothetical protein LTR05_002843 [Lithohypha guttulata]|uniref:RNA-dependent RNA polymerase n=1 Tax=Lithohypha guttulata TaxID=1690604 RepID=A0AAN7T4Y9_9EURO|nr:hypothetical protein LTR05_002843 [Lithohypha guttulata]
MPETPSQTSAKIDQVINKLNSKWGLQIRRLHGTEARQAREGNDLAGKVAFRIRAVCWKGNINVDAIVTDFEERVFAKQSQWIYKPSLEARDTVLSLPQSKSFIKNEALTRSRFTLQGRLEALQTLVDLLDEELRLNQDSDTYQRTSFSSAATVSRNTSFSNSLSTAATSFTTCIEDNSVVTPRLESRMAVPSDSEKVSSAGAKRRRVATPPTSLTKSESATRNAKSKDGRQTSKKLKGEPEKGQLTLSQTEKRRSRLSDLKAQDATVTSSDNGTLNRSFDTIKSEDPDQIFSDVEDQDISSNNTSILTDTGDEVSTRFSGGTQLERDYLDDVEAKRSCKAAEAVEKTPLQLLNEIATSGPLKTVKRQLPEDLPYWYTFELYRVSLHIGWEVGALYHKAGVACTSETLSYSSFWKEVVKICRADNKPAPPQSNVRASTFEANSYIDNETSRSVSLSARLDFIQTPENQLLDLKLNAMTIDRSCRFHRKFGADRFIVLDIPCFAPDYPPNTPEKLKSCMQPQDIHDRIFAWLGKDDLYLAGRIWRAFYVETKDAPKKRRKEEGTRLKLHLFAINGFDFATPRSAASDPRHRAISLLQLVQWHIPLRPNLSSTDLKLFARMHLGLSKTTPTIELKSDEFIYVRDKQPTDQYGTAIESDQIMTDGCALISYPLAAAVWTEIGKQNENVPSAFQARIGGAKGLWIVDYHNTHPERSHGRGFWIEVSDSQLKIKPHPEQRIDADRYQRTFEVVKTSHTCAPAHLNIQLITILENRGVPRLVLKELLLTHLREWYDSLAEAMKDAAELRCWRQIWHPSLSESQIGWCGEMPDEKEEEVDMLLESGFDPKSCRYMVKDCMARIVSQSLANRHTKLWIEIPYSTNLFCVADPTGTLQPGEIQVNFTQPVSDFPEWKLENMRVLVARNPAHLPSDIQAVKLVYRPELRHLKDVAIFPIRGESPLAGMLSGGDYDGDTVTLIWDDRFTGKFDNASVPTLPTKSECGITSATAYVKDVFTVSTPATKEVNEFMYKCISFNAIASRLGQVTKLLEKMCYANPRNMKEKDFLTLAALCGYLVDGAKAGDSFSTNTWKDLASRIRNIFQLHRLSDTPAYDDENATSSNHRFPSSGPCISVLDYLKFDVAIPRSEEILHNFDRDFNSDKIRDADLKKPIDDAWAEATRTLTQLTSHNEVKAVLRGLKEDIQAISHKWTTTIGQLDTAKEHRNTATTRNNNPLNFAKIVDELSQAVQTIEPRKHDCYIYNDFIRYGGDRGSPWSVLRASCMYSEYPRGKMPWKLVGDELCFIKSMALRKQGVRIRSVLQPIRDYMKMDLKKQRKLPVTNNDDDSGDTEAVLGVETT